MPEFWQAFLLLLIWVPMLVLLGAAVWDIFRREDVGRWHKAVWLLVLVFVPFLGALVYLVIRPPGTTARERAAADAERSSADELMALADLHDRGKLTDEEYQHEKARHMGIGVGDITPGSVREQRGGQLL